MFHIHVCIHSFPQANNKLAAWSIPANSCPIAPRLLSRLHTDQYSAALYFNTDTQ